MHELALCQSLFDQARKIVADHHASGIETIIVKLGPLSGVEAPLLKRAFHVARMSAGFPAAELEIEHSPVRVRCNECETEGDAKANRLLCARCGSWRVRIIQGDEMVLRSLVLTGLPEAA